MPEQIQPIDLSLAEGYNTVFKDNTWISRKGLSLIYPDYSTAVGDLLYGFNVNTSQGDSLTYLFCLTDKTVTCVLLDSDYRELGRSALGTCLDSNAVVTHAINYNQIVVNSPGWTTPAWGFVGSTLIPANKVETSPLNPDTPALDLFPGMVCSFADRFVWAYRNQIIINNPGTEPRTLTADNSLSFNGEITDIFQSGEGDLIVCTTNNVSKVSSDGLAGERYQGSVNTSPNYRSTNPRNAATSKGKSHGLSQNALIDLTTFQSIPLVKFKRPRKITVQPTLSTASDARNGRMFPFMDGYIISFNSNNATAGTAFLYVDIITGAVSWWTNNNITGRIKAVLETEEGHPIILIGNGMYMLWGERSNPLIWGDIVDDSDWSFDCGIAVEQPVPGIMSTVIRDVIPTLNRKGESTVSSYARNSLTSGTEIPVTSEYSRVATSVWGSSSKTLETEPRSVRMRRAVRTDNISIEIGFGPGQILHQVQVVTNGQGVRRI